MRKIVKITLAIYIFLLIIFIIPNNANAKENASINYQTHIQDVGWQNWRNEGNLAGTEGQSKRLEGIKIELSTNIKNAKNS